MPAKRTDAKGYRRARQLRKNLTPEETKLWKALRGNRLGIRFRRQHAIGPYVVDFCCIKRHLVIELDGSQHLEQQAYDAERTAYLEYLGYRVLRFWNNEVMKDIEGVLRAIEIALDDRE